MSAKKRRVSFGLVPEAVISFPVSSGLASKSENRSLLSPGRLLSNQLPAALQRNALISGLVLKQHEIASSIGPTSRLSETIPVTYSSMARSCSPRFRLARQP